MTDFGTTASGIAAGASGGSFLGPVGSVAGAAIGGLASLIGGQNANKANQAAATTAYNRQVDLQLQAEAFNREMSSTAYQRGVADMKAAGINPMLAAGQGGASSPTVGAPGVQMARVQDVLTPAVSAARQGAELGQSIANSRADYQAKQNAADLVGNQAEESRQRGLGLQLDNKAKAATGEGPFWDPSTLWRMASSLKDWVFGTKGSADEGLPSSLGGVLSGISSQASQNAPGLNAAVGALVGPLLGQARQWVNSPGASSAPPNPTSQGTAFSLMPRNFSPVPAYGSKDSALSRALRAWSSQSDSSGVPVGNDITVTRGSSQ